MKKVWIQLVAFAALSAGTYEYNYDVLEQNSTQTQEQKDFFLYGEFEEIIRFEPLYLDGEVLCEKSENIYKSVTDKLQDLEDKNKEYRVTVIGHTIQTSDKQDEQSIDSATYANWVQNVFRSEFDTNESVELSQDLAKSIYKKLVDDGIEEGNVFQEYRSDSESLYVADTKEKNNRAMVSIYVLEKVQEQPAPKAPVKKVIKPKPFVDGDEDMDGVKDSIDKCPNTKAGVAVDENGCMIYKSLMLNFKTASYEILQESMPEVLEFATFMKEYPAYNAHIIGHTDHVGKEAANMTLSQNRANEVKKVLEAQGVEASRLTTSGRGEIDPIASNRTKEGRRQNRRIEVKLSE